MTTASIVIPSMCGGSRLVELARELQGDHDSAVEVIVADNGLDDRTVSSVKGVGATVLSMGSNLGFGRAVNRAVSRAEGDALVILNDDIVPQPGFLDQLLSQCGTDDMVAGVLIRDESHDVIETAGVEIDAVLSPYDYLQDEPLAVLDAGPPPPFGPSGGAAAYPRTAFDEIGGFDEGFFAYCEDVDLAIRMRHAGLGCRLAVGARARHATSSTLGYHSLEKARIVGDSRGYLIRKYGLMRRPVRGLRVAATELAVSVELARRHHSLSPARRRVAGWRRCGIRERPPPRDTVTVSLWEGLRRRYVRSRRLRRSSGATVAER